MDEGQPRRRTRCRPGHRLQHVPDLERLPGPLRLAGHRQRRRRQAAPAGHPAAGDHGRDRPRSVGGQRFRPGSGHAGGRGAGRHAGHDAGRAPGRPDRRLHRRTGVRRVAGGRGRAARPGGLHREGRRQHRRRRLDRRPGRAAGQPGLLVHALQRPDVHDAAERLPAARRHQHRRGAAVLRGVRRPAGRGGAGAHRRRRQGRRAARRDGQRRRCGPGPARWPSSRRWARVRAASSSTPERSSTRRTRTPSSAHRPWWRWTSGRGGLPAGVLRPGRLPDRHGQHRAVPADLRRDGAGARRHDRGGLLVLPGGPRRGAEAALAAGVSLSENLTGQVYVNQTSAFSDYHGTGANPAANAAYVDAAFVAPRFRVITTRRHA